jgi:hypothetical protein
VRTDSGTTQSYSPLKPTHEQQNVDNNQDASHSTYSDISFSSRCATISAMPGQKQHQDDRQNEDNAHEMDFQIIGVVRDGGAGPMQGCRVEFRFPSAVVGSEIT